MKKIARLMTLALVVFALASCEDVPSPFGTVTPPKGDSRGSDIPPTGTGTATDPFNVQKAIDFVKELGADVESETALYVKGKVLSISEISASYGSRKVNGLLCIIDEELPFFLRSEDMLGASVPNRLHGGDDKTENFFEAGGPFHCILKMVVGRIGNYPCRSNLKPREAFMLHHFINSFVTCAPADV